MKIPISDFFDDYLEETVALNSSADVSPQRVKALVGQKLSHTDDSRSHPSRRPRLWRRGVAIAAAAVLLVAACTGAGIYARRIHGPQATEGMSDWELNRLLYQESHQTTGTEMEDGDGNHYLDLDRDGSYETVMTPQEYADYRAQQEIEYRESLAQSSQVVSLEALDTLELLPSYLGDLAVQEDGSIPDFLLGNGEMAVFTQTDGSGWALAEGDSIGVELTPSEAAYFSFYLISNGEFVEISENCHMEQAQYQFQAPGDGIYYLAVLYGSVDTDVLTGGRIWTQGAD